MADVSIGFVVFPGVTQLDFTGPYEVLSRLGTPPAIGTPSRFAQVTTHVVAGTGQPVTSDRGLAFMPTATFRTCPPLDILCVPGGAGVAEALDDAGTVAFIRRAGRDAADVTSVCTGAFLIGAAGVLEGRRDTTHWAFVDLLPLVGARPEPGRVVRDGNLFTAGGVTAGIDVALVIAAELAGPEVAKSIQLGIEYD
ncbi:MAG: DJ-1/PfpI family protein, partial [Mangrovicoccus sp.]|nr:DJ-1/PfpI family protein [Mangrovicoccus sp.]